MLQEYCHSCHFIMSRQGELRQVAQGSYECSIRGNVQVRVG